MKIQLLKVAVDELESAIRWYESESPGLGERFERAFWHAIESIQSNPNAVSFIAANIRRRRRRRFPYGIVYTIKPDRILVVAIMHLHRRPRYWRDRLRQEDE